MLFPEGLPQPVKNPPPRPLRRPPFGRRWNDPIQALLSVVYDPLPKPLFPYWRRWRNQRQLRPYRALGLGLIRKPPPSPSDGKFLCLRSRRGEIATRSCKYRFLSVRK
jgi:hypothetical protein